MGPDGPGFGSRLSIFDLPRHSCTACKVPVLPVVSHALEATPKTVRIVVSAAVVVLFDEVRHHCRHHRHHHHCSALLHRCPTLVRPGAARLVRARCPVGVAGQQGRSVQGLGMLNPASRRFLGAPSHVCWRWGGRRRQAMECVRYFPFVCCGPEL